MSLWGTLAGAAGGLLVEKSGRCLVRRYCLAHADWWSPEELQTFSEGRWEPFFCAVVGAIAVDGAMSMEDAFWRLVFIGLIYASATADWYYGILPRRWSLTLGGAGLWQAWRAGQLAEAAVALIVIGMLFVLLYIAAHGGIGGGDPWFAAALAAWGNWQTGLMWCWLAATAGAFWGTWRYLRGRKTRAIPFGPFLAGAALLVLWTERYWWDLYAFFGELQRIFPF